jgi:hypothetical protein
MQKKCSKCNETKPIGDFFVKQKSAGRMHSQCKDCYKQHRRTYYYKHYLKYGDEYRRRAKRRRESLKDIFRTNIISYLSNKKCEICSESDIRVLEFDHLDPLDKRFSVSQAVKLGYSWDDAVKEISKCRILCANCHKKHTATQANWYKNI